MANVFDELHEKGVPRVFRVPPPRDDGEVLLPSPSPPPRVDGGAPSPSPQSPPHSPSPRASPVAFPPLEDPPTGAQDGVPQRAARPRPLVDYFKKQPTKREWGPKWLDAVGADPRIPGPLATVPEETPSEETAPPPPSPSAALSPPPVSPLHGFRVPGFTFWQGRVSRWVSGFGFRKVWVTSWVSGFVKCGLQVALGFGSTYM